MYMGMLAKLFNTTIINKEYHYIGHKDEAKNVKTEAIITYGIQRYWFIYEYLDFYYYWNLILLNESPKSSTSTSAIKSKMRTQFQNNSKLNKRFIK